MWPYDDSEAEWLGATAPAVQAPSAATVVSLEAARSEARKAVAPVTEGTEETGLVGRLLGRLRSWRDRQDARSRLYAMSDRELADIGLTRDAIDVAVGTAETRHASYDTGVLGGAVHGLTRGATNWWQAA